MKGKFIVIGQYSITKLVLCFKTKSLKHMYCMGNCNSMVLSPNFRLFGCELCDRKFFRELDVVEHARRSHPVSLKATVASKPNSSIGADDGNFDPACVCSRCGKKFASKAYVDNHERSCDGMFVRQPKFTQSKVCATYSH